MATKSTIYRSALRTAAAEDRASATLRLPRTMPLCYGVGMRKLIGLLFIALTYLTAADLGGTYKGTWSGAATGDFRLTLIGVDGGEWKAAVVFTMGGEEYKTKVTSMTVKGNKLNLTYAYELQGTALQSNIIGELKGKTFEGTYKASTVLDGAAVDEGTWKASADQ